MVNTFTSLALHNLHNATQVDLFVQLEDSFLRNKKAHYETTPDDDLYPFLNAIA
jgi:hypothetical protein